MLTKTQFVNGLIDYAEAEMLPRMDGWQSWAFIAFLSLAGAKADKMIEPIMEHPMISSLGLVTEDGLIDVKQAYTALSNVSNKLRPIKIKLSKLGEFTFSFDDVDVLYSYLTKEETPSKISQKYDNRYEKERETSRRRRSEGEED